MTIKWTAIHVCKFVWYNTFHIIALMQKTFIYIYSLKCHWCINFQSHGKAVNHDYIEVHVRDMSNSMLCRAYCRHSLSPHAVASISFTYLLTHLLHWDLLSPEILRASTQMYLCCQEYWRYWSSALKKKGKCCNW